VVDGARRIEDWVVRNGTPAAVKLRIALRQDRGFLAEIRSASRTTTLNL
jgi:hypothetical protein